jgi:predicted dehydrogenase
MSSPPPSAADIRSPTLRIAMLGMIPGNGHPYSWSAIVNGFDPGAMSACPYPVIPAYLGARPIESVAVPGARVTHIWTDDPAEAHDVARAALIPHVVHRPEAVIGEVDAVMISTDDGLDHTRRARPFIEAGLPVFIDKPLATSLEELRTFLAWHNSGAHFLSSSGLRYAPELESCRRNLSSLGELRWMSGLTCKTWERYGIHLLEPMYCLAGPGFASVRLESKSGLEIAHLVHQSGVELTLPVIADGGATFGTLHVVGTAGQTSFRFNDTYSSFRAQLLSFIAFARTRIAPHPFDETVELMSLLIAGLRSRAAQSRRVFLSEITAEL